MPYIIEVVQAGRTVEVMKYYSSRYGKKGIKRGERKALTKEEQIKVNKRAAEKKLRRLINENFQEGDTHLVLVINTPEEISQQAIVRCWKGRGRTHHNPLDDTGQYAKLASYLIKQSDGMLRSPDALQGKRWNSSRNLRKPKVLRKEPVKDKGWYNRIARLPKKLEQSYYLDGDSVQEGIHEKTGYTFFTYTFVKINQTWKETELEWDKL